MTWERLKLEAQESHNSAQDFSGVRVFPEDTASKEGDDLIEGQLNLIEEQCDTVVANFRTE